MQWSQLKKRIELNFADSVRGRVQVWSTRYRGAHDGAGEAWITIDRQKVATMGSIRFSAEVWEHTVRMQDAEWRPFPDAWSDAKGIAHAEGFFDTYEFNAALFQYLNLSVDGALASENAIIRALAVLDRRLGKRRLREINEINEHPLVAQLYRFRCHAEKIEKISSDPTGAS